MQRNYEEELNNVYNTITVQIPDVDPENFKAINKNLFISGVTNLINTVYLDAFAEGYQEARDEMLKIISNAVKIEP